MNKRQVLVLKTYIAVVVLIFLFPPTVITTTEKTPYNDPANSYLLTYKTAIDSGDSGLRFVGELGDHGAGLFVWSYGLNPSILAVELLGVTLLAGAVSLLARSSPKS